MLIAAVAIALGLADPGADQDAVVATAPAAAISPEALIRAEGQAAAQSSAPEPAPHGLTTDQQIDRWIMSRSSDDVGRYAEPAPIEDDRQMHGMVSAGIGTGGYRDFGASVSVPIGQEGRFGLSYRQSENAPWGYGYGYGGYGYSDFDRYRHGDRPVLRGRSAAED